MDSQHRHAIARVLDAARLTSVLLAEQLAERVARAAWAGVVFHGTKSAFADFDRRTCGASDPGLAGPAFYFTPDPEQASVFAESPHYGVRVARPRRGVRRSLEGPQVMPVLILLERPAVVVDGIAPDGRGLAAIHPQGIARLSGGAWQAELRRAGYDGVLFQQGHGNGDVTQVVAFEPHQIVPALAPGSARAWRHAERPVDSPAVPPTPSRGRRR